MEMGPDLKQQLKVATFLHICANKMARCHPEVLLPISLPFPHPGSLMEEDFNQIKEISAIIMLEMVEPTFTVEVEEVVMEVATT